MAIQIWDAQAGQYKSADLARFGGSGTLTEALVWDGTQYVKVWPSADSADRYDYLESGVLDLLEWSDVEYVIVAGGGGGGGSVNSIRGAGGGGAGGVLTGTVTLPPGTYPITVGAGGAGGTGGTSATGTNGTSGGNSTFAEMVAIGGGGSSLADNGGGRDGQPGGSGAGGSTQAGLGGAGTPGQGHPGGDATGVNLARGGAGGGGAGGPGQNGASNAPGLGGAGISVWGHTYAAGGRGGHTGGGGTQNPGDGGQGGYGYGNGWDGAGGIVALKVRAVTPPDPTGPTPLWTDDFTSPTPHPRWALFGPYNPPGLDTGAFGPQVSDDFEVIIEADPAGAPVVGALTSDFSAGVLTVWEEGQLILTSYGTPVGIDGPSPHPPNATIGIRRQAGVWHLLVDGVSVGSTPDPFAGNALNMFVAGDVGYPVTFVSYTEL